MKNIVYCVLTLAIACSGENNSESENAGSADRKPDAMTMPATPMAAPNDPMPEVDEDDSGQYDCPEKSEHEGIDCTFCRAGENQCRSFEVHWGPGGEGCVEWLDCRLNDPCQLTEYGWLQFGDNSFGQVAIVQKDAESGMYTISIDVRGLGLAAGTEIDYEMVLVHQEDGRRSLELERPDTNPQLAEECDVETGRPAVSVTGSFASDDVVSMLEGKLAKVYAEIDIVIDGKSKREAFEGSFDMMLSEE